MEPELIRSKDNAALKLARAVAAGTQDGYLLLEGERLIEDARVHGHLFELVLVSEERASDAERLGQAGLDVRSVKRGLLDGISRLKTSPGLLALVRTPRGLALHDVPAGPQSLVLVVAGVSDPGNLGALARTAEAAGASALVVVAGGCSPWNEKALRGSMGSLLRLSIVPAATAEDAARELSRSGLRCVRAQTRGGADYAVFDWSGPLALWIAGETGAAASATKGFETVSIPMHGPAESLNVSSAGAVLLFAAARARRRAGSAGKR